MRIPAGSGGGERRSEDGAPALRLVDLIATLAGHGGPGALDVNDRLQIVGILR
jgi:hypothetical protein